MIWRRLQPSADRLRPISVDLDAERRVWRGKLYELGAVAGVEYPASALSSATEMAADLAEAVGLYRTAIAQGGWAADDDIEREALDDDVPDALTQAKVYRVHRSIERQPSHSKLVKKVLGTQCMGCDLRMEAVYGPAAAGMVDAHHLTPLSSLADGSVVTFDPRNDFAVLCPICHRLIHRMPDSGDVEGLRKAVARGRALTSPRSGSSRRRWKRPTSWRWARPAGSGCPRAVGYEARGPPYCRSDRQGGADDRASEMGRLPPDAGAATRAALRLHHRGGGGRTTSPMGSCCAPICTRCLTATS